MAKFNEASNNLLKAFDIGSTQERLLQYLLLRLGEVVEKDELAGVAGIHAWARRIRELRVEHGWPISSSTNRDDLKPGQYVLEADEPDLALVDDWRTANEIRNSGASLRERMLLYLKAVHPRSADKEQLAYVAKNQTSFPRRIRELSESGWLISSSNDDGSLLPGSYRLDDPTQQTGRPRQAIKLRAEILERDGHSCQDCGRQPSSDRIRLQIHHRHAVAKGGDENPENLVTLCSECHAGRHSLSDGQTVDELLDPGSDPDRT